MARRVRTRAALGLAVLGLYLICAGGAGAAELVAGLLVAAGVLAAHARLASSGGGTTFRLRPGWLRPVPFLPGTILHELGLLLRALAPRLVGRPALRGFYRRVPFEGGGADPGSVGRRTLMTVGVSLTPNDYVVEVDEERGEVLLRQLVAGPVGGSDRRFLELR